MILKKIILFIFVLALSFPCFGQYRRATKRTSHTEFGFFRGYAAYYGDLANRGEYINMTDKDQAVGAFLRYNFDSFYAIRFSYMTGRLKASDEDATDDYELNRGLSFENDITEFSLITEVNLFNYNICRTTAVYAPYVFFGVAIFTHNPMYVSGSTREPLIDKRTEGQSTAPYNGPPNSTTFNDGDKGGYRHEYYLTQFAIPIGLGFKYRFYRNSTIAFELGYRQIFTDYIDDVSKTYVNTPLSADKTSSQRYADPTSNIPGGVTHAEGDLRGTKNGNDFFVFFGVTVSFSSANCEKKNPVKCFSFSKWK